MNRVIAVLLLIVCLGGLSQAEPLRVSTSDVANAIMPNLVAQISQALELAGFTPDVIVLPSQRGLQMVVDGEIALELVRIDEPDSQLDNLIQIHPAVRSIVVTMIVAKDRQPLCQTEPNDYGELTISGIEGILTFERLLYPQFKHIEVSPGIVNSLKMLITHRADVTFWVKDNLSSLDETLISKVSLCENHDYKLSLYSYLNKDFAWAQPRIEAAYRKVFGSPLP